MMNQTPSLMECQTCAQPTWFGVENGCAIPAKITGGAVGGG